ncbi:MAG: MFS transporter [Candidatus Freyarchaeota archaeon]
MQRPFKKMPRSTEILIMVCTSAFVDSLGYGIIIPFLPQYAMSLGASDLDVGIIFATYALVQLVTTIPFGLLSDRYGRRPFMISGMLLLGIASLLFPLAQTVHLMIVCRAIQGLAASATWSSAVALVADTFPGNDKGTKLGITAGVTNMGGIAGPLLGGALSDVNFNIPFLLIASLSIFMFAYMFFRLKLPPRENKVDETSYIKMIRGALRIRNVVIIILINALTMIFWGFVEPLMPPYLSGRFSLSSTQIGIIFGAMSLIYASIQPLVGRLTDKYGQKRFIIAGMALQASIGLIIPLCSDVVSLTVCLVLIAAVGAIAWTPLTPLYVESLQDGNMEAYATVGSLFGTAYYVGYIIGPVIGTLVSSHFGFGAVFIFNSIILLALVLLSKLYIKDGKRAESETPQAMEFKISRPRSISHKKPQDLTISE